MAHFTETQIRTVFLAALNGEGHTEYRGKPEYAGRYIVGGIATVSAPPAALSLHDIRLMVLNYGSQAETLGAWVDNGIAYIDLGDSYYTREMAEQTARNRGEIAFWDRVKGTEIFV